MTDKQKVADLQADERDALINTAKELGIRGLYDNMYVETLQSKIDAAKAENGVENEAKTAEVTEGEAETSLPAPASAAEAAETENGVEETEAAEDEADEEPKAPKITHAEGKIYAPETKAATTKAKICHICRSKVINGVCTGCGFKLKK